MRQIGWTLAPMLATGLLVPTLGCREDAESPTEPQATPALATASAPLSFLSVSAGAYYTCGVAVDNRAYCWGINNEGQLGDGTTISRSRPTAVARGLRFIQLSASEYHTCGVTTDLLVYCSVRVRGKGGKERVVPLGEEAAYWVARWLQLRPCLARKAHNALFLSTRGKRLDTSTLRKLLPHPHRLRHAFATHLLEGGGPLVPGSGT